MKHKTIESDVAGESECYGVMCRVQKTNETEKSTREHCDATHKSFKWLDNRTGQVRHASIKKIKTVGVTMHEHLNKTA